MTVENDPVRIEDWVRMDGWSHDKPEGHVNDKEVLLYLHIPKVGGTTMRDCIFKQYAGEYSTKDKGLVGGVYYPPWGVVGRPVDLVVPDEVRAVLARTDVRAVLGHFWFGIHQCIPGPSTYITLLREPVDRVVSLYYLLKLLPVRYDFPRGMSLREFARTSPYREVDNDQTRRIAGADPPIGRCTRSLLEKAKQNLCGRFSVVGTTERFDETLVLLKRIFGWTLQPQYWPRRQNPSRPDVTTLTRATVKAIEQRNSLDAELHAFANQLLDAAIAAQGPGFQDELEEFRAGQEALYELETETQADTLIDQGHPLGTGRDR